MNVNLQTRIAGQGGMPVIDAPTQTGEGVNRKVDDISLNITENKSSGPMGLTVRRELDAPEVNGQTTLNDLDRTLGKLDGAFGNLNDAPANLNDAPTGPKPKPKPTPPPTPPPAPKPTPSAPDRIKTGFNVFAVLDLIQQASSEMTKASREITINERKHKAAVQEQTGEIMRKTGEASASAATTGAILNTVMTGVGALFTCGGFVAQYMAFSKVDVNEQELVTKESTDMLKEIKGFKKVDGEDELFGKVEMPKNDQPVSPPSVEVENEKLQDVKVEKPQGNGQVIELQEVNKQQVEQNPPPKENVQNPQPEENVQKQSGEDVQKPSGEGVQESQAQSLKTFKDEVSTLSGKVHNCEQAVEDAEKGALDSTLKLKGAQSKLREDFKAGDNSEQAKDVRKEIIDKRNIHEQCQDDLRAKVDEHIKACKEFKGKMEERISAKEAELAKETDSLRKNTLKSELKQMQSVYNRECYKMGEKLTTSLNRKIAITHQSINEAQMQVQGTSEMAWAKGFEMVVGLLRQGFEAGQGYNKMAADKKEALQREHEHLSQASETQADTSIELGKQMQEDWKHTSGMVVDLRKMLADLEYQTMNSIFKG